MKQVRKIIKIDEELCDGCGLCVPDCAEGSLVIVDGKAKLVADRLCDGLGACLGACPTGALKIIERTADEFDEEAVEEYLKELKKKEQATQSQSGCGCSSAQVQDLAAPKLGGGCPSAQIQTFSGSAHMEQMQKQAGLAPMNPNNESALSHWPIQIRLVPPTAPFLKDADLLIAADCTAIAALNFQTEYLQGKKVVMGCPKFDDAEMYIQRFTEILQQSGLNSITILIMEVPCCASMNVIVKEAIKRAGSSIPVEQITLSRQGTEIKRINW